MVQGRSPAKSNRSKMVASSWKRWKRLFNVSRAHSSDFTTAFFQKTNHCSYFYLMYRWTVAIAAVGIAIGSFLSQKVMILPGHDAPLETLKPWKWFIYLTHWGVIFIVGQAVLALIILQNECCQRYRGQDNIENGDVDHELFPKSVETTSAEKLPKLYRAYWVLHIIATDLAFVISSVYWVFIYRKNPEMNPITVMNIGVHGLNSGLMLIDLFVTSHEFRIGHFIYPFSVGMTYSIMSLIYYHIGGTGKNGEPYIYAAMDWKDFWKALSFVLMCGLAIIISHGFSLLLRKVRNCLCSSGKNIGTASRLHDMRSNLNY